ncbi:AAA family ATPase [Agrobacterium deltaense]|uniref:AAA family ATPase n=1 Tax=Agrobacterium deltaense TaxID=1183412 RepID=UPI001639FBA9|nr:AAA family ATPase [Agrobacterium deltaense]
MTYVERDSGLHERRLNSYLDEAGQLCLITGPSKTGKTTLYKRVLAVRGEIPLVVQCTRSKTAADIWREALSSVNFERVTQLSKSKTNNFEAGAEVESEASWAWLAKITGKLSLAGSREINEEIVKERILADPSPDLLIPVLKHTRYVLIIEDFHYLEDDQKVHLFQQWKRFIDNEISIVVLGTSHRAVDIASSNKDLLGRIGQIDIGQWSADDLKKICAKGFAFLQTSVGAEVIDLIVNESVGLPIITQQTCLEMITSRSVLTVKEARKRKLKFDDKAAQSALYQVANHRYSQFATYYQTLIRGPREKTRIYKTYEYVLACFTVDPISFDLTRADIDRRLEKLCRQAGDTKPPAASVNSTLGALQKFQQTRDFQLLEWRPTESKLYIIEPSFLFYVRWRTQKEEEGQLDFFELLLKGDLLERISIKIKAMADEVEKIGQGDR